MVLSAPSITFNPTLISYGVINVGSSSAFKSYHVRNDTMSENSRADARNASLSFVKSNNSDEAELETWVLVSTADENTRIGSLDAGPEAASPSVAAHVNSMTTNSINVRTKVIIPSGAATSGQVDYKQHFRFQFTG